MAKATYLDPKDLNPWYLTCCDKGTCATSPCTAGYPMEDTCQELSLIHI